MKTHVIRFSFLSLILYAMPVQAQYQSIFGSTQTSWKIIRCQLFGCEVDSLVLLYGQDTTIANDDFKRVRTTLQRSVDEEFYLREDTATGEVWYRSVFDHDSTIYKISDMSLQVNDTLRYDPNNNQFYFLVDSVYNFNGKKHIQLNDTSGSYQYGVLTLIEGVGPSLGVMYDEWYSISSDLLCQQKNDTTHFENNSNPNYTCDSSISTGVAEETIIQSDFLVYPNPSSSSFIVEIPPNDRVLKVELFSLKGELIKEYSVEKDIYNLNDISEGVYLISITTRNHIYSQKLIKSE